ncbi:MAG: hypothetical protein H7A53_12405 [Akkermansiaceae bacterium]|nr:hypothetical protein [Akkermansiaceae bacterium]MCP5551682.1 hypothetical protein [Akkermansiaceae bacterium]
MLTVKLDSPAPEPRRRQKAKTRPDAAGSARANRRAMIGSIVVGSVIVHAIGLLLFGVWTVATYLNRPAARFEMKKVVKIPAKTPEHKMNVAKHEAMAPKPVLTEKLVSTRPVEFALPDLPEVNLDQMLPLDPSELISEQVAGIAGTGALGNGLGQGLSGGGGTGEGMSFFGIPAEGTRIVLLFDVSSSVVNAAAEAGVPLDRIKEETLKLIEGLGVNAQFSIIQFTQNFKPFGDELRPATDANKAAARDWVENEWVESGTMSGSGVVSNPRGLVTVLERAFAMRPDLIFLISDASFQWREGGGISDIPYDDLNALVRRLEDELSEKTPIQFIGFAPDDDDIKEWRRIVRRTGGDFREIKGEPRR